MRKFTPTAFALAVALAAGGSIAQSQSGTGAIPSGTGGAGSSATGGRSAPAAQPSTGTRQSETTKDDKVAKADRQFIEKAAGSGMFEVQAAQLATTKARSPDVKSYAGMLVDHHTKANDELTKLANARSVELPAAPPRAMRKEVEDLAKKEPKDFDKAFLREVGVKAHEKDIKLFEKASKDAKDPELKAFVDKTLPLLRDHLAQARKLEGGEDASKMGASGGGSTRTGGGNGANRTGS
jgi:putative membrane protein